MQLLLRGQFTPFARSIRVRQQPVQMPHVRVQQSYVIVVLNFLEHLEPPLQIRLAFLTRIHYRSVRLPVLSPIQIKRSHLVQTVPQPPQDALRLANLQSLLVALDPFQQHLLYGPNVVDQRALHVQPCYVDSVKLFVVLDLFGQPDVFVWVVLILVSVGFDLVPGLHYHYAAVAGSAEEAVLSEGVVEGELVHDLLAAYEQPCGSS